MVDIKEQELYPTQEVTEQLTPRKDEYVHIKFQEEGNEVLVDEALKIHAEGYRALGFINEDAIDKNGHVVSAIDHARGPSVDYYLAIKSENEPDNSLTVRMINIPNGEDFTILPAYKLCGENLNPDGLGLLLNIPANKLKELAALSRTSEATEAGLLELLRDVYQDSYGKNEYWFFSVVDRTLRWLEIQFGSTNFMKIGSETTIEDPRVKKKVILIPALFKIDDLFKNMMKNIAVSKNGQERDKLVTTFLYFLEGIPEANLSEEVVDFKIGLKA